MALMLASQARPLTAEDAAVLQHDAYRAMWEETCFGLDNEQAKRRFDRRFGARVKKLQEAFKSRFTAEELRSARDKFFGPEFVYVGGCRSDRSRPDMDRFQQLLKRLEASASVQGE